MTTITINPTSTPNFFDVLSSNEYDHYPLLVEQTGITCGCPGFTRWNHCKHADEAAATLAFQAETSEVKPVAVPDTDGKEVTCPCCGAWMMAWAWGKHLNGNFCEMYLKEKGAAPAAPASELTCADCGELTLWCGCHTAENEAEIEAIRHARRSASAKKAAVTRSKNQARKAAMYCKVCGSMTIWCEHDLAPVAANNLVVA